ncbi:MAG: winged helix-turn-helix transcriptional regulator [Gammaproteobacteria bacterium]|uniref:Winged helix-turn-helix transcriptional regulator n=1 Tax=Candidatus Thiopontia autotrophica TaxID=2841688 RepID=A0A8J6TQ48_9GAMM|nr:winged helix-turn-helix transcriptional regulator [Candidatus Thiopontia autotrophica]MBL6969668.1 winged helix-turn-helix transcriptional regulator [Gammaproteobacteria bacterium]
MEDNLDLPSDKGEIQQISSALQAISHPTRLKILCFLGDQEKIVNEILEYAGSTQSNISQHLEVLRNAGVIQSRRVHNKVYCSVQTAEMRPLIAKIKELFCSQQVAAEHGVFSLIQ